MFSILAAVILLVIVVLNILLIAGAPLGEFTMGGQYKVLPKKMRVAAILGLVTQIFAMIIVLQSGGYLDLWFSYEMTRIICFVFAGYFVLNSVMNLFSRSKKEKYVMTPLALVAAVCYLVTGWEMQ